MFIVSPTSHKKTNQTLKPAADFDLKFKTYCGNSGKMKRKSAKTPRRKPIKCFEVYKHTRKMSRTMPSFAFVALDSLYHIGQSQEEGIERVLFMMGT